MYRVEQGRASRLSERARPAGTTLPLNDSGVRRNSAKRSQDYDQVLTTKVGSVSITKSDGEDAVVIASRYENRCNLRWRQRLIASTIRDADSPWIPDGMPTATALPPLPTRVVIEVAPVSVDLPAEPPVERVKLEAGGQEAMGPDRRPLVVAAGSGAFEGRSRSPVVVGEAVAHCS